MKALIAVFRAMKAMLMIHPYGRTHRKETMLRFLRWQVASRILDLPVLVPYVDGTRLLIRNGMHGATSNFYVGLRELEDMAFVLHLLKTGDLFVDVGANIGEYSILAASRGARVLAIEPVPETYRVLLDNIFLNRYSGQVDALNVAVGGEEGTLHFSTGDGPTDHVIAKGEAVTNTIQVSVVRLCDVIARLTPTMIKVDVEGFESEVIRGAEEIFANPDLQVVLMELNGLGTRYGFRDENIHKKMLDFGFLPVKYCPFERRIERIPKYNSSGNTVYFRPNLDCENRLKEARAFCAGTIEI